ncbi:phosphopantothenoylcysteine decarboxylase-like [Amphibalanus amphitrite]|uniref:phosphopantothenoylcysteine decarboxylase-like n=1 Tax=Amphibalanus amphitrite TaxID=1232801 RepID=UPI001C90668B|nr:phosphopantothenoylcysteine decarboxylase-like [Amphibalanus amphitrite]XP_043219522.1 phosphopantothenoylcysteine decarboxylase-like [Amphibalanus amphitrite]XP_043219524.1 phosphopantothenoylcysteine decarboxylase-like [Amphibalanus amphitrite]
MADCDPEQSGDCHILLCCTGSVASLKVPELAALLQRAPAAGRRAVTVRVVSTDAARHFFSPSDLPPGVQHYTDADEWSAWRGRGDPVLHIALREWAHLLLVAPLDANSLAKLATGLCDTLVTCVARAWPLGRRPVLLCPAMNTEMWRHPVTAPQLETLRSWGCTVQPPVQKTLVCGETGVGAMAHLEDIRDTAYRLLEQWEKGAAGTGGDVTGAL